MNASHEANTTVVSKRIRTLYQKNTDISSGVILRSPTPSACSFPSATIVTTWPTFRSGVIWAPLDVKPGHMTLAPASTNVIAPLSTCMRGHRKGSVGTNSGVRKFRCQKIQESENSGDRKFRRQKGLHE